MCFSSASDNIVNAGIRKVIGSAEFTKVETPNYFASRSFDNKVLRFSEHIIGRIKTTFSSSFLSHILHIIFLSSQEKVVGSNTGRIIAFVTNIKGLIKRAIGMFVGNTVSFLDFSNYSIFLASKLHNSVTTHILPANPQPAIFGLNDMSFKPLLNRSFFGHKKPYITGVGLCQI